MWGPTLTAPDSFGWAKGATLSVATIISGGNVDNNVAVAMVVRVPEPFMLASRCQPRSLR